MTSEVEKDRGEEVQRELRGVLPAGTALRGYEVKSILGQGAFGITYRARDVTLDRDVAVKEYLPTSLALREGRTTVMPRSPALAEQFAWGRERFLDEARTLARLDRTTAIVRVYDFLEANGTAYMIMALVEGETLNKRLQREQRLTPEAVERLVFPLLDGLEEIHTAGFLHRDIKPANIMVDVRGRPTLIDFGASRAAMAEHSATLTAIFTPGYAAVEQFSSVNLGPWSDIYGLAATLYHAITGRIPPSAIERILKDTYEPLSQLQPPDYSPALLAAIDAALAVRIDDRPQSIAEWRGMLRAEELLASARGAARVAFKPRYPGNAAGRSGRAGVTIGAPVLSVVTVALVLLLAAGAYLAFQVSAPVTTVSTAALALSAGELEQALSERRKADALAEEKRQRETEARRKADAEAEAKRQAETELEQARQARQKAEDDLARLKADIAARRQAEAGQREQADASVRRVAEEAAQRKAEDEAAGLRLAEEEVKKKAVDETDLKAGTERPVSRQPTALAKTEEQKAEEAAKLPAVVIPAPKQPDATGGAPSRDGGLTNQTVPTIVTAGPAQSPDGLWRGTYKCEGSPTSDETRQGFTLDIQIRMENGSGTWKNLSGGTTFDITVSVDQDRVAGTRSFRSPSSQISGRGILSGRYDGNTISATGMERSPQRFCELALSRV